MGSGRWNADTYTAAAATRSLTGKSAFHYSDTTLRKSRTDWKVHDTLDPKRENQNGPFAGKITREAADTTEHPTTVPIAVIFDETGSMRHVPVVLQEHLPKLLGNLQQVNGVDHPAILFGGVGDTHSDRVPLQIGQFESDNRMDEHLGNLVLEGNGGGGDTSESYDMALYFLARHTHIDAFEKRGEKGYAFIIGDEYPRNEIEASRVNEIIGDGLQGNIALQDIIDEVQQKWELFFVFPTAKTTHAGDPDIKQRWVDLLGVDYVLEMPDAVDVADLIGTEVGVREAKKTVGGLTANP